MTKTELLNADRCVKNLSSDFDAAVDGGNTRQAAHIIQAIQLITDLTKKAIQQNFLNQSQKANYQISRPYG